MSPKSAIELGVAHHNELANFVVFISAKMKLPFRWNLLLFSAPEICFLWVLSLTLTLKCMDLFPKSQSISYKYFCLLEKNANSKVNSYISRQMYIEVVTKI